MSDAQIQPLKIEEELYRYSRNTWLSAGVDNFAQAPAQNPDMFQQLTNILPPETNVLQRRFGYVSFTPKLDAGQSTGDDRIPANALYGTIFDGENTYVSTVKSVTFNKLPSVSVEFWFQTTTATGGYFVSQNANSAVTGGEQQYLGVFMKADGTIGAGYYNGSSVQLTTQTPLAYNDSVGHQCAVTFDGVTIKIYVDGALVVTTTVTSGSGTVTAFWRMAQGSGGTGWPTGLTFLGTFLSHVSIFPLILSGAQVLAHFNAIATTGGSQANLEVITADDAPTYFWYLNETQTAVPPAQSSIVQTAKASFLTTNPSVVDMANPVSFGNTMVVAFVHQGWGTVAANISDSQGNSYTQIEQITHVHDIGMAVWFAPIGTTGPLEVTVSPNSGVGASAQILFAHEIKGVVTNPLDGSQLASGSGSTFSVPAVETAASPDLVFAIGGGHGIWTIPGADGFGIIANQSAPNPSGPPSTISLVSSYQLATSTGSFPAHWTNSQGVSTFVGVSFALTIVVASSGSSNNAFDYADANTGTYVTIGSSHNSVEGGFSGTGGTYTLAVTADGIGIQPGNLGLVFFSAAQNPGPGHVTVTSLADDAGNTWTALTPVLEFTNTGAVPQLVQVWTAPMQTTVAPGGTLNLTLVTNPLTSIQVETFGFFNLVAAGAINVLQHTTGTCGTSGFDAGAATTTVIETFVGVGACKNTLTNPSGYTPLLGSSGGNNARLGIKENRAAGTFTDTWTNGGLVETFVAIALAFQAADGTVFGQYIIIN